MGRITVSCATAALPMVVALGLGACSGGGGEPSVGQPATTTAAGDGHSTSTPARRSPATSTSPAPACQDTAPRGPAPLAWGSQASVTTSIGAISLRTNALGARVQGTRATTAGSIARTGGSATPVPTGLRFGFVTEDRRLCFSVAPRNAVLAKDRLVVEPVRAEVEPGQDPTRLTLVVMDSDGTIKAAWRTGGKPAATPSAPTGCTKRPTTSFRSDSTVGFGSSARVTGKGGTATVVAQRPKMVTGAPGSLRDTITVSVTVSGGPRAILPPRFVLLDGAGNLCSRLPEIVDPPIVGISGPSNRTLTFSRPKGITPKGLRLLYVPTDGRTLEWK